VIAQRTLSWCSIISIVAILGVVSLGASAQTIAEIIGGSGDGVGTFLAQPLGVAVDPSGNVYVTGASSDNAFKITPGGVITEIIDATGDGAGNTMSGASLVAVDTGVTRQQDLDSKAL
jgi:DNA-binding beta-propeller fold protein YncE